MTEQELIDKLKADDGTASQLYDALLAEHGHEAATAMWDSALAEIDHDAAVAEATASLADLLTAVQKDLGTAGQELARLTTGAAWHVEYQGTAAEDIGRHLDDAARAVRAAEAVHHGLAGKG